MTDAIRAQILSDARVIDAMKADTPQDVTLTDHDLPASDQNFGLLEAAAIVAFATSVTKLAELLVKVYKDINDDDLEVTIKTARGALTVKGKQLRHVEDLVDAFKDLT